MANRFQELFRIKPNLYHEGSPVIIEAAAIQKDIVTDTVLAQVKIRNLRDEKIIACKISIRAYEPNGMEVEGIHSYPYLDINAGLGEAFGSKIPVYLPDMKTRRISISVIEAVYADNYVWKADPTEWEPVPNQELIADAISDPELRRQYYLETDGACSYVPAIDKGLFLCTCGSINLAEAGKCYKCKKTYSFLSRIYNMDYLKEKAEERLELEREKQERAAAQEQERLAREKEAKERAERAAAEEREKREKQKRKRRKALMIGIPATVLCVALVVLTPTVIMPAISNIAAYRNASWMLEAGDFDNAKTAFEALSGYKDADTMALEAMYRKAEAYCENKDYNSAIQLWKGLNGYADSDERVQNAETSWKEEKNAAAYSAAKELMEKKDYVAAAGAFDALGGFLDSADLSAQCEELRKESIYQSAVTNIEEERYDEAITILQKIQGYKDSDMLLQSAAYDYGCVLMDEKKFRLAPSYFSMASGYKDADTKKLEANYENGCQCLDNEDYASAILIFNTDCVGYKDSCLRLLQAKYGYASAHLSFDNNFTHEYIKELMVAGYPGSEDLYSELYDWSVEIINIGYTEHYGGGIMKKISRNDTAWFEFIVKGGEPGETADIIIKWQLPGCESEYETRTYNAGNNRDGIGIYFTSGAKAGTASVSFYKEGELIGYGSVEME